MRWGIVLCVTMMSFVLGLLTSEAGENPPSGVRVIPPPQLQPGSWWTIRNGLGEELTIELKRVEHGKFITWNGREERAFTNEWNAVDGLNNNGAPIVYSPHRRTLSFYPDGLWEGKTWGGSVAISARGFKGRSSEYTAWGKATKLETITIPAGSFDAMRVEITAGTTKLTCWYTQEIQRLAKCESSNPRYEFEVVKYKVITDLAVKR